MEVPYKAALYSRDVVVRIAVVYAGFHVMLLSVPYKAALFPRDVVVRIAVVYGSSVLSCLVST